MARIVLSYSHQDEPWKDRVARQFRVLAPADLEVRDDRRIAAGAAWFRKRFAESHAQTQTR